MKQLRPVERGSVHAPACIGVDLSLNGTGLSVCIGGNIVGTFGWTSVIKDHKLFPDNLSLYRIKDAQCFGNRIHRLKISVDWVMEVIESFSAERQVYVAIEGYALSRAASRVSDQHEQGGMLKLALWEADIPFRIYTPSSIKSAWTGNGQAQKSQMQMACYQHFDFDATIFGNPGEDLADALLIAQMLTAELELRAGRKLHPDLPDTLTKALTVAPKKKKKVGTPLIEQPFIKRSATIVDKPKYNNWNLG